MVSISNFARIEQKIAMWTLQNIKNICKRQNAGTFFLSKLRLQIGVGYIQRGGRCSSQEKKEGQRKVMDFHFASRFFINKKFGNRKTKTTEQTTLKVFIINVVLVFSISNFFFAKTSLANNWRSFSSSYLALLHTAI